MYMTKESLRIRLQLLRRCFVQSARKGRKDMQHTIHILDEEPLVN